MACVYRLEIISARVFNSMVLFFYAARLRISLVIRFDGHCSAAMENYGSSSGTVSMPLQLGVVLKVY
jgi:hypothetical protein